VPILNQALQRTYGINFIVKPIGSNNIITNSLLANKTRLKTNQMLKDKTLNKIQPKPHHQMRIKIMENSKIIRMKMISKDNRS